MPRTTAKRILRTVTLPLWKRDQLEMRAIDRLLAVFEPKRTHRRARATTRARSTKRVR